MTFQGAHVVIPRGSSGIGKEIAWHAIRRGAVVIGRSRKRLTQCVNELRRDVNTHQAAIANEADVKRVFGEITRIDHLVTTGANLTFKPFLDLTDSDITRCLDRSSEARSTPSAMRRGRWPGTARSHSFRKWRPTKVRWEHRLWRC